MKFLITGITGFAGAHLANLLHRHSHKVHGLIRCSNGREADIRDVVPDSVYRDIDWHYGDLQNERVINNISSQRPSLQKSIPREGLLY